jgi:hypothetical protein
MSKEKGTMIPFFINSYNMTIQKERPIPICSKCHIFSCLSQGVSKLGYQKYRTVCRSCHNSKHIKTYRLHKKNTCEKCGFIPHHLCQLDVDHIDGNHMNNDPSNLMTLCANCHRLKTHLQKDHSRKTQK